MKAKPRLLVLDDDTIWIDQLASVFEDTFSVDGYASIDQGLQAVQSQFYDIVILDLNFVGDARSGIEVFRKIQTLDRGADAIVVSAETNPQRLIEIFNAGVSQFVSKPVSPDKISGAVNLVLQQRILKTRALELSHASVALIGSSPRMVKLRAQIDRLVKSGIRDILLSGETGTGKEVVAKAIVEMSDPRFRRLIPVNCTAISEGLSESALFGHVRGAFTGADRDSIGPFEAARGGFVLLDEIGDMPLRLQGKILRVLQERKIIRVGTTDEKEVSFRSISATHVNLEKAVEQKTFREDLYYRIAAEVLELPSLRQRTEDIPELVHFFISKLPKVQQKSITTESLALLQLYSWPGNIRQLRAVTETLISRASTGVIREKDVLQVLPEILETYSSRFSKTIIREHSGTILSQEKRRFENALIQANGHRSRAAEILQMSRATFFRRAKELGLIGDKSKSWMAVR